MLKTVQVSRLRDNIKDALTYVKKNKKPLTITERGIASSVLLDIDSYEDLLAENNKEFLKSIRRARKEYERGKIFSMEDVFSDVA